MFRALTPSKSSKHRKNKQLHQQQEQPTRNGEVPIKESLQGLSCPVGAPALATPQACAIPLNAGKASAIIEGRRAEQQQQEEQEQHGQTGAHTAMLSRRPCSKEQQRQWISHAQNQVRGALPGAASSRACTRSIRACRSLNLPVPGERLCQLQHGTQCAFFCVSGCRPMLGISMFLILGRRPRATPSSQ